MRMLLCTIAASGLCAALSARAQNIVTNGSFEDGTLGTNTTLTNKTTRTNWITGWELYQGNPTNSITNSLTLVSGGTDGTYAARYSVQSTPGSQANQVGFTPSTFMPVSLAFGSNFTFSLDLKRVDAGLADFRWIVFQRDSSNTLIGSATTFNWGFSSITTNWQTFSTNLALNPSTANLEFQFRYIPQGAFTSATVDIDNIQAFGPPVLPWVWNNAASNFSWATGVTNWTVNGNATNWVNGYGADFGATGAGTITVSGTNTVTSLSVSADGYSFTGGTLALGSAETAFAISNATTVASTIAGSNALLKTGNSTLTLSGANTYTGATTVAGGTLRIDGNSRLGNTTNTLTISNAGVLEVTAAGTLTNAMTIGAGNGVLSNSSAGALVIAGAVSKDGTVFTSRAGSGTNVFTGVISGASANSDFIVDGGTTVFSNVMTYNGPTIITNGGTLVLGVDDAMPSGSDLILGGGTFLVDVVNYNADSSLSMGTLTLTEDSTIDLGGFGTSGVRNLLFADSSGVAINWNTNAVLTITNWQGVANQTSAVTKLLFGTGGLTTDQLAQIRFADQDITGGQLLGGDGELAPIPEAPVWMGALAVCAFVGWQERRRLVRAGTRCWRHLHSRSLSIDV